MRPTRAVAALAVLVAVLLPLAVTAAPADARPGPAATRMHVVKVKGKKTAKGTFFMVGTVSPRYDHKPVFILRQVGGKGRSKAAGTVRTDAHGVFEVQIFGPQHDGRICWLARVPATAGGYATSYSNQKICVKRGV